ncbi:MAG: glycoside hydrolase N-terminal domain-containing protein [Prolixibacteraceae bacterium]|nr:glycoside hydrolase N-terminal domain-containing protein [Prolixibacteraceae bacterium]
MFEIKYLIRIFVVLLFYVSPLKAQILTDYGKGYESWLPAATPDDAMLLGNGEMGAMVFGHPHNETIIVNHSDIYLPTGLPVKPITQTKRLDEIKKLILNGNGTDAAKIPIEISKEEGYKGQAWSDPYVPAFDIHINLTPGNIEKYKRALNFETGEAVVSWIQNGNNFERTQFISRADGVFVIRIKSSAPFDVQFDFDRRPVAWNEWDYVNSNYKNTKFFAQSSFLNFQTEFVHQWQGNIAGYEGVGKVIAKDGVVTETGNAVFVKNTREVFLFVKVEAHKMGESFGTEALKKKLNALSTDYNLLLDAHKKIHSEMFNRVSLNLNGDENDKKLDSEVMRQEAKKRSSAAFVEKQFYAARYNILSATGKNVPHLQGIWGSSLTPPWSSDYTHDGNLPVAISSFLCSNMPELMSSFFDYHDARMNYYRDNATKLYGCRGIMLPSHSSSHGWNVHFDPIWCLTFWTGGAAWTAHFYYDYFLYTNDIDFLEKRAYPFMKEAALFYEDFMTLDKNGKYVFNPSYSPENNPANNPSQATVNATMDVVLAKELLHNLIHSGKILKENSAQITKWQNMLAKLPNYEVDSTGALREWLWPGYTENHHHRHLSHLYGMYDIIDPDIAANPVLWNGVKKALDERMKVRRAENGGIMVFGMVQLAWVAANLGDAEMVQDIVQWLSAQYWSNSMATFHDPNGLFNMDLSGGFQTVIIRSLLYSEPGLVSVLPAKPPMWESGSIAGIKARNQLNVNELIWNRSEITISLKSEIKQRITLKFPTNVTSISVAGKNGKVRGFDKNKSTAIIEIPANTEVNLNMLTQ